jgi:hypothetical protein
MKSFRSNPGGPSGPCKNTKDVGSPQSNTDTIVADSTDNIGNTPTIIDRVKEFYNGLFKSEKSNVEKYPDHVLPESPETRDVNLEDKTLIASSSKVTLDDSDKTPNATYSNL